MRLLFVIGIAAIIRSSSFSVAVSSRRSLFSQTLKTWAPMSSKRTVTEEGTAPTAKKSKSDAPTAPTTSNLPFIPDGFNATRARVMTKEEGCQLNQAGKCVVYWMSRDQRAVDNHAIHYAQSVAKAADLPLKVVFNLVPKFLEATIRQYGFMIKGLAEVERTLRARNIPLHLLTGDPVMNVPKFAHEHEAMLVVTDFSPLRVGLGWVKSVANVLDSGEHAAAHTVTTSSRASARNIMIPLVQVDAHNIVPCWVASPKLEYSARTIRSKIQAKLAEYLTPIPPLLDNTPGSLDCDPIDWDAALTSLEIDRSVPEVTAIQPGTAAAFATLDSFVGTRMKTYADQRNDPNKGALSGMSPYLHFGQISAQAMVLRVKTARTHPAGMDSFVEESVVRRELSDNFCLYNPYYDSLEGCYGWARATLHAHRSDPREYTYTRGQFEAGDTHDDLWNAAQLQMVQEGKMHGFLRMYWAKKILEWTESPEQALQFAIYLNDKYELDGRDPNGYAGCMWSIGGIHDQGWGERAVFGKIRFMNYKGCQRKFDVKKFVARYPPAAANAAKFSSTTNSDNSIAGSSAGKGKNKTMDEYVRKT